MRILCNDILLIMMTSSNGNNFRVTGPLCEEFTTHRRIPLTKASDAELWFFYLSLNKRLSKQLWGWWSVTPSGSLWRHFNRHNQGYVPLPLFCDVRGIMNIVQIESEIIVQGNAFKTAFVKHQIIPPQRLWFICGFHLTQNLLRISICDLTVSIELLNVVVSDFQITSTVQLSDIRGPFY